MTSACVCEWSRGELCHIVTLIRTCPLALGFFVAYAPKYTYIHAIQVMDAHAHILHRSWPPVELVVEEKGAATARSAVEAAMRWVHNDCSSTFLCWPGADYAVIMGYAPDAKFSIGKLYDVAHSYT